LVLLTGFLPVSEVRGAIPLGLIKGLSLPETFILALIGNLFGVATAMLFLRFVYRYLISKSKILDKIFDHIFSATYRKFYRQHKKWGKVGLVIFVALPLPMTGGYSGAIAAFLFKIPFKQAIPLISLGVVIAAVIVTGISFFSLRKYL